jgi:hypothetical protein
VIRGPDAKQAADLLYTEVADLLRGRDLDVVFDVLINHIGGLVVANAIDPHRTIEAFKDAERAYRARVEGPIWTPGQGPR